MMKKTIASLGIAAAASAGALLLTGSPASAQTTPASAQGGVAYAQQVQVRADHHFRSHRWHHDEHRYYYWHRHHYYQHRDHGWNRGWDRNAGHTRIEINNGSTDVDD